MEPIKEKPKWYIKFLNWIKSSAEGKNQTASGRRLSAFYVTVVIYGVGRYWYMSEIHEWKPLLYGSILDVLFIGLLWGFVNFDNLITAIIDFRTGRRKTTETKIQGTVEEKTTIESNENGNSNAGGDSSPE